MACQPILGEKTPVDDESYMREALRLARKGLGRVSPNPMVGAVVVRDDTVIGKGYHKLFGGPHAEVNALEGLEDEAKGATLYVTLEPCCHYGKTPPCADLIIKKQIGRVVIGTEDPNPLVAGRGIKILKDHGIAVDVGVLRRECHELNAPFFKYFERGLPFVTLKMAQSLDGRIATRQGSSRWISSPASLRLAHRWRAIHDAVMVGVDTVIADNPSLTVRLVSGKNPLRLVLDSHLRIPLESRILVDGHVTRTVVVTTDRADPHQRKKVQERGARVLTVPSNSTGQVDLTAALRRLAGEGITSILVEGGAKLSTSFVKARLVDQLLLVIGSKIVGAGIDAMGDLGIADMNQAVRLSIQRIRRVGDDLIIMARIAQKEGEKVS
jgi:diaminohydroxyphosphoribosylaminopyrimidine deaminase/5-amino-6-(5-phosphoribosylamino)uracil reductase